MLEDCEARGGVDLAVTNYYYVHSDGIGDRSIDYSNALPENRIFGWQDTKKLRMHQMLTIHSRHPWTAADCSVLSDLQ